MDSAHPIPQNVTQFEFHLIGDMTLKQFLFLAAGLGSGYLIFVLFAANLPYMAYPLIAIAVLLGIAFAFLPIHERPLDHWTKAFFKAIFSPTQRKYESSSAANKTGGLTPQDPLFYGRLKLYLSQVNEVSSLAADKPKLDIMAQMAPGTQQIVSGAPTPPPAPSVTVGAQPKEEYTLPETAAPTPAQASPSPTPVQQLIKPPSPPSSPRPVYNPNTPKPAATAPTPTVKLTPPPAAVNQTPNITAASSTPVPDEASLNKIVEYAKEAQIVQTQIVETERELNNLRAKAAQPGSDQAQFANSFNEILTRLQALTKQASEVSKKISTISTSSSTTANPKIKVVYPDQKQQETYIALTSTPNIINGIVTDSMGNYLEGVIVVTHDKEGLPVRALKTNKLGQFIAATPLPNGIYTITLEKESLNFDVLEVELDGKILPPIKIAAKKGGN